MFVYIPSIIPCPGPRDSAAKAAKADMLEDGLSSPGEEGGKGGGEKGAGSARSMWEKGRGSARSLMLVRPRSDGSCIAGRRTLYTYIYIADIFILRIFFIPLCNIYYSINIISIIVERVEKESIN